MDIRQQDIGLLMALDVLFAERNVTRAAARMNLSQPAMSAQLARLRDLFGDPLLIPSGRTMILTSRAEALKDPLTQALADLSAVLQEGRGFDPFTSARVFCIAASDYVHRTVTLPALSWLAKTAPKVRIALLPLDTARSWHALEQGKVDLLITSDRLTPQDAKARRLYTESFVFAQRMTHPRGTCLPSLDEFCSLDHVLVSPESGGFKGATDEQLDALGRSRNVAVSVPSFLLALPLLQTSDLVAVLPKRLAQSPDAELAAFPLPFEVVKFDIMLSWHPRSDKDSGHKWLRDSIFDKDMRV
ncbi:LysR family transcriptional regulator [Mameliella alba]|nr:LysR family transcriptional regulator [Antarctobacter heliothermus]MBY6142574.1 LysR family transcriptional regulator [Mameliella alba]MCA0953701.1 LysR family transcriptional regulator [Mameliella alba]